ncbi:MAG: YihY/virulence factor BrkB family protein [Chlamydiales bacterium]
MGQKGHFFKHGVWRIRVHELKRSHAFWVRILRVLVLIGQGFTKSQVQIGASSLTFYSILSAVPLIAFFMGLAQGFLLKQTFQDWLLSRFDDQKEVVDKLIELGQASLQEAHRGVIIGVGAFVILWAGIRILIHLEIAMNRIWEVKQTRNLARRFSDYMALLFICPVFVMVTMSLTAYFSGSTVNLAGESTVMRYLEIVLLSLLNLIPVVFGSILFTFIYIFIPNTRVSFLPALWAGVLTAVIYQLVQWAYIYFQLGVMRYSQIYGALAALPLFIIWLYLSWIVLLLGAKMSFAFQNVTAYEFMTEDIHLSNFFRQLLCLRIAHLTVKKFQNEENPPTMIEISNLLSIPLPLTAKLLHNLTDAKVLAEVKLHKKQQHTGFQPARSIDQLTIKRVIDMISHKGEEIPLPDSDDVEKILDSFDDFSALIDKSDKNYLLKDI